MKFTFKTEKPTGKWKSFQSDHHFIKIGKKEVGTIDDLPPHKIRITVVKADINEDKNPNCNWKWVTLAKKSESIQAAKEYLNTNIDIITARYSLKQLD